MLTRMTITASQADALPETNAIARTPDETEFYLCVETAKELEVLDSIVGLIPEIEKAVELGASTINMQC